MSLLPLPLSLRTSMTSSEIAVREADVERSVYSVLDELSDEVL